MNDDENRNPQGRQEPVGAPGSPDTDHVAGLLAAGLEVSIQPSGIRVFSDQEYAAAGAAVVEDLEHCDLVLGRQRDPRNVFFAMAESTCSSPMSVRDSPHNMPMLRRIVDSRATLIDHGAGHGRRGAGGLFFSATTPERPASSKPSTRWVDVSNGKERRRHSPALKRPLELESLENARALLGEVGNRIAEGGLPDSLAPVVVGFTGYGNVSEGAQAFFDLLPHEEVLPNDSPRL